MPTTNSITGPVTTPLAIDATGRVRFTREHYDRMIAAGVVAKEDRVELLDGELAAVSPIGPRHASILDRLTEFFVAATAGRYTCRVQGPLALSDVSEPEPDLMVLKRSPDGYGAAHPQPADVLLLIEVAQSSSARDFGQKRDLYAAAGIVEYWIVDVETQRVVVHRLPQSGTYDDVSEWSAPQQVAAGGLSEAMLDLGVLFA